MRSDPSIPTGQLVNSGFRNGSCLYQGNTVDLCYREVSPYPCVFIITTVTGKQYCCVNGSDASSNIMRRYLQTNASTALQNSPTCCSALDIQTNFSKGASYALASGIYYKKENDELDKDSPRNGRNMEPTKLSGDKPNFIAGDYYAGCTLNLINRNIECR